MKQIDGRKTYGACVIGIVAILFNQFVAQIPGMSEDPAWLDHCWQLVLIMTGRSALNTLKK